MRIATHSCVFDTGSHFVMLQAVGWALYSVTLVLTGVSLYYGVQKASRSLIQLQSIPL